MGGDLITKTNKELEIIISRAENTNVSGSLFQRAKIELELRDRKIFNQSMFEKRIKRGKESWDFIYLVLGIFLAIEASIISIIPLEWKIKTLLLIVAFIVTGWLCLSNSWFQNILIGLKIKIEETWRKL